MTMAVGTPRVLPKDVKWTPRPPEASPPRSLLGRVHQCSDQCIADVPTEPPDCATLDLVDGDYDALEFPSSRSDTPPAATVRKTRELVDGIVL